MRGVRLPAAVWGVLLAAGLGTGCNPGTTPTYPQPDVQTFAGEAFPIRAGDLVLVVAEESFLYLSVQTVGADSRCPVGAACEQPGFLELTLELESADSQGAIGIRINEEGEAVGTYRSFEIRVLGVEPPGRAERILPTEYTFVMAVTER